MSDMQSLNWQAITVAALSSFLLGGLWYSKVLFGTVWNLEADTAKAGFGHPAKVFGRSFLFAFVAAAGFAYWLGPNPALEIALQRGLLVGVCFIATSFGINYQFANRSTVMWLIDGGYHTVQFLLFGLVLGLWH
jgi:hypothetical protein